MPTTRSRLQAALARAHSFFMRGYGGALALALLVGCGGEMVGEDAGPDAGSARDAGSDAGNDAGSDGGPRIDAGLPDTVEMAAMMTASEAAEIDALVGAVPPADLEQGAFVDLAALTAGIDRIIGEDGLQTLALDDPAMRALADLHFVDRLVELLTEVTATLSDTATQPPEVLAVGAGASQLNAALTAYRDELRALFVARRDAEPLFTPAYFLHEEHQVFFFHAYDPRLVIVVDVDPAQPARMPLIRVDCTLGLALPTMVAYADEATGIPLSNASGTPPFMFPVTVPPGGRTLPLRVDLDFAPFVGGGVNECTVITTSMRHLRAAPHEFSSTGFSNAGFNYRQRLGDFLTAYDPLATGPDAALLAPTARQVAMLNDALAPLLGGTNVLSGTIMADEDVERAIRLQGHVDAMMLELLVSPQLGRFPTVVSSFSQVRLTGAALANEARGI